MAKSKKTRVSREAPAMPKPTLSINSKGLRGKTLKVGKNATVVVRGRVVEESIRDYEAKKGTKTYRLEVDKVSIPSKKKRR